MTKILFLAVAIGCIPAYADPLFGDPVPFTVKKSPLPNVVHISYPSSEVYYDCGNKGALMIVAPATRQSPDSSANYTTEYYLEKDIPGWCQPLSSIKVGHSVKLLMHTESAAVYRPRAVMPPFVGLSAEQSRAVARRITNYAPALTSLIDGPLKEFDSRLSCIMRYTKVMVVAGLIYSEPENDYFRKDYGINTPDFFYYTVFGPNGIAESYMFSNGKTTTGRMNKNLQDYAVAIEQIENIIGLKIPGTQGYNLAARGQQIINQAQFELCFQS